MHHTGAALAKEGYVVLCPDALCFEERADKQLSGRNFERFEFLRYVVDGKCMAWKNILDMRRAIDFLVSRPEVDAKNIGCYGHSMGSTHLWMAGPWEERLKCLVGNCCLPTYRGIHRQKILHCFPNFVPGFHHFGDTPDIAGLIAPRALHLNFGDQDGGTPIEDVPWSVERIAAAYEAAALQTNSPISSRKTQAMCCPRKCGDEQRIASGGICGPEPARRSGFRSAGPEVIA